MWTCGRGTALGWTLSKSPFPGFASSLRPLSPPPPPTTRAKRHTDVFHEVCFTVIKEEGLHIRPLLTPPSPVCPLADAAAWFSSLHIRGVGQEVKSLCLTVRRLAVVCSST